MLRSRKQIQDSPTGISEWGNMRQQRWKIEKKTEGNLTRPKNESDFWVLS